MTNTTQNIIEDSIKRFEDRFPKLITHCDFCEDGSNCDGIYAFPMMEVKAFLVSELSFAITAARKGECD